MKKLDVTGSKLCTYQAQIFLQSVYLDCSSKVFLRRFFKSSFSQQLDHYNEHIFSFDTKDCFQSIIEQFGQSSYGTKKINSDILYWLGYITRYICYTRNYSSRKLYKNISIYHLIDNYEVYHTQNEEWVIKRILEYSGNDESMFDKNILIKKILHHLW